ncbi:MAG: (E)-4-hydroxy-3-methylbut-2-enyl-diphosphate synthase [Bacteroidetes bacterium]|nr:(E)-4-hydroxy-3-methylbut-2-enyl-diphosphate synthase [Bacteroidota bacterium]
MAADNIKYKRFRTRVVDIGGVPLGGNYPLRLQSMTTTDTMDTIATVEQSIRIIEAGGEYVRITAPSIKEAKNLENIKNELRRRGYQTPLVADIHFTPNAAEIAARIVEKVRVNPGNYADKKKFETIEYTDKEYSEELERIREKFVPLVKICKEYGTAMRIGTNHGSLSDRIMSRFGDTPLGMVESAMEFLRICEDENYYSIVLSMKASNPQVMVEAYRLLVQKMTGAGMNYPLHLGVTEAGEGEDGRIKSALGIGALLEEGYGDTIRVSLTEEPEFEIPVCRSLAERYAFFRENLTKETAKIFSAGYKRKETVACGNTGGKNVPVVIVTADDEIRKSHEGMRKIGYYYSETLDKWNIGDMAADYIYLGSKDLPYPLPGTITKIFDYAYWRKNGKDGSSAPLLGYTGYKNLRMKDFVKFVEVTPEDLNSGMKDMSDDEKVILVLSSQDEMSYLEMKSVSLKTGFIPVVIKRNYGALPEDKVLLNSSTDVGGLLIDGFGDGIWLESQTAGNQTLNSISFGILQASRTRISRTEYISCPSCGRTLFDLQETTAKVREKTNHLKGLKIGIMGCIVNGPGEMADADYGYVGSGPGRITLYKGKVVVKRSIPSETAVAELINLIKENGDWTEQD